MADDAFDDRARGDPEAWLRERIWSLDRRGVIEHPVLAPGEWSGLAPDGHELFTVRSADLDRLGRGKVVLR